MGSRRPHGFDAVKEAGIYASERKTPALLVNGERNGSSAELNYISRGVQPWKPLD